MFDWKSLVRERLGALPLDPEKQDDIFEELAQQLEAAYQDELAKGADRFVAVRRSMAQFHDWEKLRNEVFQSVNGAQLPVWEQQGILSARRSLVWISLALSLAFLLLPAFRKALNVLPFFGEPTAWDSGAFSDEALQKLENRDQQKYAKALAYVALHSPDPDQASAAAEKAIALDPQLTWIAASVSGACCGRPRPDAEKWIDRLKGWDPENAYPYHLHAQATLHAQLNAHRSELIGRNEALRKTLAADQRWRAEMEKAFSAPHMDSYFARQFQLDRDVLLERGLDDPDKLLMATASAQLPDLVMLKTYADYLVFDVGAAEQKAGRIQNALSVYRNVALFGQKLAESPSTIEKVLSVKIRKEALESTILLLRRTGRDSDATTAELALAATLADEPKPSFESSTGSRGYRSGQLIFLFGLALLIFATVAAVWLLCLTILRLKPNLSRRLNWLASHSAWAPALLPICSLSLLIAFFPYARSIGEFLNAQDFWTTYDGLARGYISFHPDLILDVWIDHMFWPLISCAALAILGAIYLRWAASRRQTPQSGLE